MANYSLKDELYAYLNAQASLTTLLDSGGIGWGSMPTSVISKRMIIFRMISDVRAIPDSTMRSQRWRFWICFPETGTAPKAGCLAAANKLMDLLHNMSGTLSTVNMQYSYCIDSSDPEYDEASKSWICIHDYNIKMQTLQ